MSEPTNSISFAQCPHGELATTPPRCLDCLRTRLAQVEGKRDYLRKNLDTLQDHHNDDVVTDLQQRDTIATLTASLTVAQADKESLRDKLARAVMERDASIARLATMLRALEKYGVHDLRCDISIYHSMPATGCTDPNSPGICSHQCSCGLTAALAGE